MTYELAKQLKEAGFPGLEWIGYLTPTGIESFEQDKHGPTLEELIEACGEHFYGLIHDNGWWASDFDLSRGDRFDKHVGRGENATEAVAKLWLALNKKNANA